MQAKLHVAKDARREAEGQTDRLPGMVDLFEAQAAPRKALVAMGPHCAGCVVFVGYLSRLAKQRQHAGTRLLSPPLSACCYSRGPLVAP